jgi:predicted DCC family thiol-disulfide oxidoreductase YuxK
MKKESFNQALIYDDHCPLCKAYTAAFVKGGLLQNQHRISFSEVNIKAHKIDWEKAKHEIPLINLTTGEVKYGVDALAEILQQKIFFIQPIFKIKVVNWCMKKLYALISYNRKIIVAKIIVANDHFDCSPRYNFFWRLMFAFVLLGMNQFFIEKTIDHLQLDIANNNFILFNVLITLACFVVMIFFKKKLLTDAIVHILLSVLVASSFVCLLSFILKYFLVAPIIFYVVSVIALFIFTQQIIQRYHFMKHTSML